jgi:hypothetical protein
MLQVDGRKFKIACAKKVFTNEVLAEAAGVGVATVVRAKRGEYLRETSVAFLAEALDVDIGFIVK